MKKFLDRLSNLDEEWSIWVEEADLGREKVFQYKNSKYAVKIPGEIDKKITLRLNGLGKKRRNKTGNLYLHVWLNKGEDIRQNLWIADSCARNGADKRLCVDGKDLTVVIPPKSYNGLIIRLKGCGRDVGYTPLAPLLLDKKRGNALVKLMVYPDSITPRYGSFGALSTDEMALEGWVYRKIDEVLNKVGRQFFHVKPLTADKVADLLNETGWHSIFLALVNHLNLTGLNIQLTETDFFSRPGRCKGEPVIQNNQFVGYRYIVSINGRFLDNPFSIAAILAHELCHVLYSEKIEKITKDGSTKLRSEKASLEEERTVDLLVFMFKIGEFQLRVARDTRLTLGYFDQEVFDRMQVIVSRKLDSI